MKLQLRSAASREPIEFDARALVVAGFTGKDRDAVAAHIDELERIGVSRPSETPAIYPLPISLLTTDERIRVSSPKTSAEVEPVLFCDNGRRYLGVGSDHTARDLELVDIPQSKAACAKVVGTNVIDYDVAVQRWPALELRSRTGDQGELYQEGRAGELLPIPELLDHMHSRGHGVTDGTVVFLGTLPLKGEDFVYGDRWLLELAVPGGPILTCSYSVEVTSQPEVNK